MTRGGRGLPRENEAAGLHAGQGNGGLKRPAFVPAEGTVGNEAFWFEAAGLRAGRLRGVTR